MPQFFIQRPVFAWVVALFIILLGVIAIPQLPVAHYPSVLSRLPQQPACKKLAATLHISYADGPTPRRGFEQTFFQRRCTNGQQAYEKVPNN